MWTHLLQPMLSKLPFAGLNGTPKNALASPWSIGLQELTEIRSLEDDWDGQGALAPSSELVESAEELARELQTLRVAGPSCVVPGVNGTVVFEWEFGPDLSIEIEVTEPGAGEGFLLATGSQAEYWSLKEPVSV